MRCILAYLHCVWGWGGKANAYYFLDQQTLGGKIYEGTFNLIDECPYVFDYLQMCYGMTR